MVEEARDQVVRRCGVVADEAEPEIVVYDVLGALWSETMLELRRRELNDLAEDPQHVVGVEVGRAFGPVRFAVDDIVDSLEVQEARQGEDGGSLRADLDLMQPLEASLQRHDSHTADSTIDCRHAESLHVPWQGVEAFLGFSQLENGPGMARHAGDCDGVHKPSFEPVESHGGHSADSKALLQATTAELAEAVNDFLDCLLVHVFCWIPVVHGPVERHEA